MNLNLAKENDEPFLSRKDKLNQNKTILQCKDINLYLFEDIGIVSN